MSKQKLYLCDGYACSENHKAYCYMNGGDCHHTSTIEHALSLLDKDFPATKFIPVPLSKTLLKETFVKNTEMKHGC